MFSDPDQILSNQRFKGNSTPEKDAKLLRACPHRGQLLKFVKPFLR
jgi:hypothetical protein